MKKNIVSSLLMSFIAFISCNNNRAINQKFFNNLTRYKDVKVILYNEKERIEKEYFKHEAQNYRFVLYKDKSFIGANTSVSNASLFKPKDLAVIESLFKDGLVKDFISVGKDGSIEFEIGFYNGGITDSTYYHSILFEPVNSSIRVCADTYLLQTIEEFWKYRICRTAFE